MSANADTREAAPSSDSGHLRLALGILGIIGFFVVAVCGATISTNNYNVLQLEARVRLVEQAEAANAARFESIKEDLRDLKNRKAP